MLLQEKKKAVVGKEMLDGTAIIIVYPGTAKGSWKQTQKTLRAWQNTCALMSAAVLSDGCIIRFSVSLSFSSRLHLAVSGCARAALIEDC